ncbi:MAG: hypothetical protein KBS55_05250 [Bacteroidales bacterium]|nr:hypothetical protein [Candidatus Cryptobacteroides aphodequi]
MSKIIPAISVAILFAGCQGGAIYQNDSYTWFPDHIVQGEYTGTAVSPTRIESNYEKGDTLWECRNDLSVKPALKTPFALEQSVYNMALDESINAIEPDGTLRTGTLWGGVWTRDVSYSTILSMAYIQPEAAMTSLKVKIGPTGNLIQDTGTGGAWPCSTDRQIWTVAVWELYKVTGDREWFELVYPTVKKSIEIDLKTLYDEQTGLVRGESSFIDWRKQSYPRWMQPADICDSKCLGTNALHYSAVRAAASMAAIAGDDAFAALCLSRAEELKTAINTHLWMEDKGYYAQYIGGRHDDLLYTKSETLGESLTILNGIAEGPRAEVLSQNLPSVDFGTPVFWPWIPDIPPYHNNAVWPFVQSYWMWASARTGNETGVLAAIGSIYRAAAIYATNKENLVAFTGDSQTECNSGNMLWSLSGALSITYRVLFGMSFKEDRLEFAPFVPKKLKASRSICAFPYRNALLDIEMSGYGDRIKSITLDGKPLEDAAISASLEGRHSVKIVLSNSLRKKMKANFVKGVFTPMTPAATLTEGTFAWGEVEGAARYDVICGGSTVATVKAGEPCEVAVDPGWNGDICVIAVSADNVPSFPSEPVFLGKEVRLAFDEVKLTARTANDFTFWAEVPEDGIWSVQWEYANGSGAITHDRKCAIRTLSVDGRRIDTAIFPQRGENLWNDWGYTTPQSVSLSAGRHSFNLSLRPENENMDIEINDFAVRALVLTK